MGESRSGRSDPDGDSRGGRAHCKRRRRDNRHQAATRPDIERQPCLSVCLNLRKLAQTGDVHIVSMTRNMGLNDILIVVVDGLFVFWDSTHPSVQTLMQPFLL